MFHILNQGSAARAGSLTPGQNFSVIKSHIRFMAETNVRLQELTTEIYFLFPCNILKVKCFI